MFRKNNLKILMLLLSSCFNKNKGFQKNDVWERIIEATERKDTEYLLNISRDTLQCLECNNGESWINKEDFFKKKINQMSLARSKEYTYFIEELKSDEGFDKRVRISYLEDYKENEYSIIYTILTRENKIQFLGVFSVP